MNEMAPINLDKVDAAKGVQHWSLAPNKGERFTEEELAWFPGRVARLRWLGFNKYHVAKIIASETGRSIDSIRYQCFHSMKLWPPVPKEHPLFRIEGDSPLTKEEEMTLTKQNFREQLQNVWTPSELRTLRSEATKYVHGLAPGESPTLEGMAIYCQPALPGRTLSAIRCALSIRGCWIVTPRNNKPKRRRKTRRRNKFGAVKFAPAGPLAAGKVRLERTFKCPGCGLKSEVV